MDNASAHRMIPAIATLLLAAGCAPAARPAADVPTLAGAWQSNVQFQSGAFAGVKDLAFMYAFGAGGTLSESSNYDAAPPVPPAYGTWRHVEGNRFEAHYAFFTTRPATAAEAAAASGGWLPAGHGELSEHIRLAADGQTYEASIAVALFDAAGKRIEGGGEGSVHAWRMKFGQ